MLNLFLWQHSLKNHSKAATVITLFMAVICVVYSTEKMKQSNKAVVRNLIYCVKIWKFDTMMETPSVPTYEALKKEYWKSCALKAASANV